MNDTDTIIKALTGDEAAAEAMRQINPGVVAAYPITPQTEIVMSYSQFVANGLVDTEMIPVESEHSAMSACVGASAAGVRAMTATSANGLALMWEVLYIAASNRLPIVMTVVNRALSAPINIHCDHSDTMGARDSGWMQIYCENAQEVYELLIMAVRIAEHPQILLPAMVCEDGFITSHSLEGVRIFSDEKVRAFLGEYKPKYPLLDVKRPVTYGPLDLQNYYFEHKRQQVEAMKRAKEVIPEIFDEFEKFFGKRYGFIESYKIEDAEIAIIALSSTCGTVKTVVDELRQEGKKVGLIKLRFFRPFPKEEIIKVVSNLKIVGVLDRSDTFSTQGGPVFTELKSALYGQERNILVVDYVYGLGGRDIYPHQIKRVFCDLMEIVDKGKKQPEVTYLGVRE